MKSTGPTPAVRPSKFLRGCWIALLVAGCATAPPAPPPAPLPPPPPPPPPEFVIEAGMLDTWNAVGQILVNTDGVTYNGRSQMLGMYDVDYRGERLLLIAKAFVLDSQTRMPTTLLRAASGDGKPDTSAAAMDLLHQVQARLPGELHRIANLPPPAKKPAAKKKSKRH